MPGYGVGDAASTLVGQTYGAGRRDLCKSFAHLTIGVGMLVMALMGVVMYVLAPEMIGFLSPVEAIRQLGAEVLRIEAFAEPFFAAAIVSYARVCGCGRHAAPGRHEPLLHVVRAPDAGLRPGAEPWPAGRVDRHGHGADLPRVHLPVAHPTWQLAQGIEVEGGLTVLAAGTFTKAKA